MSANKTRWDTMLQLIGDRIAEYISDGPEFEVEVLPEAEVWHLRARWHKWDRYLKKSDGWTQALVDEVERLLNELPED